MRRPAAIDFVFGGRLVRVALLCSSFYALYLVAQRPDLMDGGLLLASLALGRYGTRASKRVASYRAWKVSWDQMAAPGASPDATRTSPGRKIVRALFAFASWVLFGLWLLQHPRHARASTYASVAAGFGALTLWGLGAVLLPLARRMRGKKRKDDASDFVVRVCPAVPTSAPSLVEIRTGLPAYAQKLLTANPACPETRPST